MFLTPPNQPPWAAPCFGNRNYCIPRLKERLAADGQYLMTPPVRRANDDPGAAQIKRARAWDLRRLTGRLDRKVLAYTLVLVWHI